MPLVQLPSGWQIRPICTGIFPLSFHPSPRNHFVWSKVTNLTKSTRTEGIISWSPIVAGKCNLQEAASSHKGGWAERDFFLLGYTIYFKKAVKQQPNFLCQQMLLLNCLEFRTLRWATGICVIKPQQLQRKITTAEPILKWKQTNHFTLAFKVETTLLWDF